MVRYVGWVANTVLFVLCCFLVADTANAIIAAWLAEPAPLVAAAAPPSGSTGSSWEQRQIIISRNLFHSSELAQKAPEPEPVPDILEETELPLKLWGTIASQNPDLAWASVEELDARAEGSRAVRVGDNIKTAEVLAIERARIVLLENGIRRALTLDEDETSQASPPSRSSQIASRRSVRSRSRRSSPSPTSRTRRSARKSTLERVKQLAEDRFEVEPEEVEEALNNPASLYTQARILPKVGEDGAFTGIEISSIKPGSVFEQVGIEEGDIITAVGGEPVNDVSQTSGLMNVLTDGDPVDVTVLKPSGETQTMQFQFPEQ